MLLRILYKDTTFYSHGYDITIMSLKYKERELTKLTVMITITDFQLSKTENCRGALIHRLRNKRIEIYFVIVCDNIHSYT